jgi:hypothetical protein
MTHTTRTPRLALALLLAACGPDKADTDDDATDTPAVTDGSADTTEPPPPTSSEPTTADDSTTEEDPGNPAGVCDPSADSLCPTDYVCCSDDPATVGGKTPNFFTNQNNDEYGAPIFSGNNNPLSTWGRCVAIGGFASPFASGCPVPCNPTWEPTRTQEICGVTAICCPFTQLDPAKDCVIDPDTQRWRAVTGKDIGMSFNGVQETWGDLHTTNQDPTGASCMLFASGGGGFNQAAFEDCIDQLSVADQRGFCYSPDGCPCTEDLCDQKNPDYVPKCPP